MGPDRIELRGLRVRGAHGATAGERSRPQPLEVDIDLECDLRRAAASDDLVDTIDYGTLTERVAAVVSGESHALLERVAERIAEVALADPRAVRVTVSVRKLSPPLPADIDSCGVRVTRP